MSHKQVRARVEHGFARRKTWKILRDCRFKGDGVHYAMLGIARVHNLALVGKAGGGRPATNSHAKPTQEPFAGRPLERAGRGALCEVLEGRAQPRAAHGW